MILNQEFKGLWSVPGNDEYFSGILTFNTENGPKLELIGDLNASFSKEQLQIIQGRTTTGYITLFDVRRRSGFYSHQTLTGITTYQPTFIFLGHAFDKVEDINFTDVHFTAFNLREWISVDAIAHDSKGNNHTIEYKQPENIFFELVDGGKGKIEFGLDGDYLNRSNEIRLEQFCKVVFSYGKEKPFRNVLSDIFRFIGLVTLCTYEQSYPMSITFFKDSLKDQFVLSTLHKEILQPVQCLYRNSYYKSSYKLRDLHQHLVRYDSISTDFSSIVANWFKEAKEIEPVIELLLRPFRDKLNFSTEKFMDAMRAIETFHRRKHNNRAISKDELKQILDSIEMTDLSPSQKDLVKEKLNFAYEPTLKQRLEEMVQIYKFPYFEERVPDEAGWVKKARDSRNYYTHFDKSIEKKALT